MLCDILDYAAHLEEKMKREKGSYRIMNLQPKTIWYIKGIFLGT